MATFAELTAEQQDVYTDFERTLRAWQGQFQRLLNSAASINTQYNAQMQAILVALDDNTIVPNTSGLAGAAALDSDSEMVTLVSHLQGALTTYNTSGHQELRVKAAGLSNTLGVIV